MQIEDLAFSESYLGSKFGHPLTSKVVSFRRDASDSSVEEFLRRLVPFLAEASADDGKWIFSTYSALTEYGNLRVLETITSNSDKFIFSAQSYEKRTFPEPLWRSEVSFSCELSMLPSLVGNPKIQHEWEFTLFGWLVPAHIVSETVFSKKLPLKGTRLDFANARMFLASSDDWDAVEMVDLTNER